MNSIESEPQATTKEYLPMLVKRNDCDEAAVGLAQAGREQID